MPFYFAWAKNVVILLYFQFGFHMAEISYKCLFLHIQLHQNDSAIIVFCTVDFIALSFHYTVYSVYYNSLMEIQFVQFVPILNGKNG